MKIVDGKIVLEKISDSVSYEDFIADVNKDGTPRYAIKKLAYESLDGRPCEKLVSLTWNPDNGAVKNKMLYSGSKDALKAFDGISVVVNATDASEMTLKVLVDACTKV
eukprot:CAMPEP_0170087918 /NCGR_PEP_ID=MMETSP0019_2-20121128/22291_1 /TAXON_ID=98059 /ORGANISM="Dinobryon sp., Strain UTEXLB2267" /LENGTH=107 /DNA_ID=CAMNT_0010305839 /DNA_START=138 /DNA_END=461 /DNA_ORIENTATION=+